MPSISQDNLNRQLCIAHKPSESHPDSLNHLSAIQINATTVNNKHDAAIMVLLEMTLRNSSFLTVKIKFLKIPKTSMCKRMTHQPQNPLGGYQNHGALPRRM